VEEDAGEDVLRGVVGDGLVQVFAIRGWKGVEGDVFEAEVRKDGCVEEDEGHVAGGFGGNVSTVGINVSWVVKNRRTVHTGLGAEVIECMANVFHAKAKEGFANEFGAEFGEIEGSEDRGLCFFCTRRRGTGGNG